MLAIDGKGIRNAAWAAENFFPHYKSHIPTKAHLATGFGIQFDTFGELGSFLVQLGAQASFDDNNRYTTTAPAITPDDARLLVADLQIDPLSDGLVAFFPGWELTNE